MLNQLSAYIIIGLIVALLATSAGFAVYRHSAKAEIATLTQENVLYKTANETQKQTILTMENDAKRLADANSALTKRIIATEMEFVDEWEAVDALDLASGGAGAEELEKRANDEFQRSIEALRAATAK